MPTLSDGRCALWILLIPISLGACVGSPVVEEGVAIPTATVVVASDVPASTKQIEGLPPASAEPSASASGPLPTVAPDDPVAFAAKVVFSPSGDEVAFTVSKAYLAGPADVYVLPVTGEGVQTAEPRLLGLVDPDAVDALSGITGPEISAAIENLADDAVVAVIGLASSATADRYAVTVLRAGDYENVSGGSDILIVDPDGSEVSNLTKGRYEVASVGWSPDGGSFALFDSMELVVLDAQTGDEMARIAPPTEVYGGPSGNITFSPDGRSLLIAAGGVDSSSAEQWSIATGERRMLVEYDAGFDAVEFPSIGPTLYGPGRNEVIYPLHYTAVDGQDRIEFHRVLLTETMVAPTIVTELDTGLWSSGVSRSQDPVNWTALAPDGAHLLFRRGRSIWRLTLDSGQVERVTPEGLSVYHVATNVDGRIAYIAEDDQGTKRIVVQRMTTLTNGAERSDSISLESVP